MFHAIYEFTATHLLLLWVIWLFWLVLNISLTYIVFPKAALRTSGEAAALSELSTTDVPDSDNAREKLLTTESSANTLYLKSSKTDIATKTCRRCNGTGRVKCDCQVCGGTGKM